MNKGPVIPQSEFIKETEEEKKKKKRELENYLLSAEGEKKAQQEIATFKEQINLFFDKLHPEVKKKNISDLTKEALKLFAFSEYCKERSIKYFSVPENSPEEEEINENLKAVGLERESFAAAAFSACGKYIKKIAHFLSGKDPVPSEEETSKYDVIRDEAILAARKALLQYRNGNSEVFAKLMAEGLKESCEAFIKEEDKDISMQWSMYAEEMLKILKNDKKLLALSGLNENQLRLAEKAADMGRSIKRGLQAMEMISEKVVKNEPLPGEEDQRNLLERVNDMGFVIMDKEGFDVSKEWNMPESEKNLKKEVPAVHR